MLAPCGTTRADKVSYGGSESSPGQSRSAPRVVYLVLPYPKTQSADGLDTRWGNTHVVSQILLVADDDVFTPQMPEFDLTFAIVE